MTTVAIGGITLGTPHVADSDGRLWTLSRLSGWGDGFGTRAESINRPSAAGAFAVRGYADPAVVAVGGAVWCPTRALAADAKRTLNALLADGTYSDLTVADDDEGTLTSSVRRAAQPTIEWIGGLVVTFGFTWHAPDPLRYGPLVSASTGFPNLVGGLEYDLFTDGAGTDLGYLDFGDPSIEGAVEVSNSGTAPTWPAFLVTGPVDDAGFDILASPSGATIRFEGAVPVGSTLIIDAAAGTAVIDGTADRGGPLSRREWTPVPAAGSIQYTFVPLGARTDAQLRVQTRPAFW